MNIIMTVEEYKKIRRLLDFADWYIDDMEPSNPCYEDDKEDVTQAQEIIDKIDANIDAQYTTPTFEPATEEYDD